MSINTKEKSKFFIYTTLLLIANFIIANLLYQPRLLNIIDYLSFKNMHIILITGALSFWTVILFAIFIFFYNIKRNKRINLFHYSKLLPVLLSIFLISFFLHRELIINEYKKGNVITCINGDYINYKIYKEQISKEQYNLVDYIFYSKRGEQNSSKTFNLNFGLGFAHCYFLSI